MESVLITLTILVGFLGYFRKADKERIYTVISGIIILFIYFIFPEKEKEDVYIFLLFPTVSFFAGFFFPMKWVSEKISEFNTGPDGEPEE